MKKAAVVIAACALSWPVPALARDVMTYENIELQLGMTREEVLKSLRTRYDVGPPSEELKSFGKMGIIRKVQLPHENPLVGEVWFRDGSLVSASRTWTYPSVAKPYEVGAGIYGIASTFVAEARTACILDTWESNQPEYTRKTVDVRCGLKILQVWTTLIRSGIGKGDESVAVVEVLTKD